MDYTGEGKDLITFGKSLASFPEDRPAYRPPREHAHDHDHVHTSHLERERDHNYNYVSHTEHEPGHKGDQGGKEEDEVKSRRVVNPSCKLVSMQDEVARQEGPM